MLHAILFFQQALAGNFFSKSPTPPPPFPFKSSMVGPLAPEKKFATEWDQQRFQKNFSRFYRDGDKRDNKKTERGPVGAGRGEYFPKRKEQVLFPNLVRELQLADREFYFRTLHLTFCYKRRDNGKPSQQVSRKKQYLRTPS